LLTEALRVNLPDYQQARLESAEFTAGTPAEYRADAVVALAAADTTVLAIVVEAQSAGAALSGTRVVRQPVGGAPPHR
jgi:hypothetical protein